MFAARLLPARTPRHRVYPSLPEGLAACPALGPGSVLGGGGQCGWIDRKRDQSIELRLVTADLTEIDLEGGAVLDRHESKSIGSNGGLDALAASGRAGALHVLLVNAGANRPEQPDGFRGGVVV